MPGDAGVAQRGAGDAQVGQDSVQCYRTVAHLHVIGDDARAARIAAAPDDVDRRRGKSRQRR